MAVIIDTRGMVCPQPIITTRRAISGAAAGTHIEVLSDSETVRGNLMTYLGELGYSADCVRDDGVFHITFTVNQEVSPKDGVKHNKEVQESEAVLAQRFSCKIPADSGYAVVIRGKTMGVGDDKLGVMLMRSFINSLSEVDNTPSLIVLYNEGVTLAIEGSDTAESLQVLQNRGVEIIVCGSCTDYFGINDRLGVGTISNMLAISNKLANADKIIYP